MNEEGRAKQRLKGGKEVHEADTWERSGSGWGRAQAGPVHLRDGGEALAMVGVSQGERER